MVVAMGHTSECGVVVVSVGGPQGPWSVLPSGARISVSAYRRRTSRMTRSVTPREVRYEAMSGADVAAFPVLPALSMAPVRHQHWPPPYHTHWYDPWRLQTGPALTAFRSGGAWTTPVHPPPPPPTITPLRALQTHEVRALHEETASITKRNRYLHPKTSRTGYCKPPGALIWLVCEF